MRVIVCVIALCALACTAQAHETTRSYVTLTRTGADVALHMRVAFRDVEVAVWMDENLDGRITWSEASARLDAVSAYLTAALDVASGGPCMLNRLGEGVSETGGIDYLDLDFAGRCPDATTPLTITSRLFAEIDPDHRMFLETVTEGRATSVLLSRTSPTASFAAGGNGALATFLSYIQAGGDHLLGGADHILFLLVLILPAACTSGNTRAAARDVIYAVTGFTLAHAVTLTAATTNLLRPPPDIINAMIAISIAVTAVDNITPILPGRRATIAAFFGTIHGMGFASALGALTLSGNAFLVALLGFNLGIELTQIAVVLVTFPALYMLRGGRWLRIGGSVIAAGVSLVWLWQRVQDPIGLFFVAIGR